MNEKVTVITPGFSATWAATPEQIEKLERFAIELIAEISQKESTNPSPNAETVVQLITNATC